jgi:prophage regulatory protein
VIEPQLSDVAQQDNSVKAAYADAERLTAQRRTGLGRSTIHRLIAERKFPSPVKLTGRAVGWRITYLDRWSAARLSDALSQPEARAAGRALLHRFASSACPYDCQVWPSTPGAASRLGA